MKMATTTITKRMILWWTMQMKTIRLVGEMMATWLIQVRVDVSILLSTIECCAIQIRFVIIAMPHSCMQPNPNSFTVPPQTMTTMMMNQTMMTKKYRNDVAKN
jgi:hypothetical protein